MAEELTLHSLDKRVARLEDFRKDWEKNMRLILGETIEEKLNKRFGWQTRLWQNILQAVIIALILYFLGLSPAG